MFGRGVKTPAPEPKPWVCRLVENQGLPLTDKAIGWWSVHLDGFLRYAVKRGEPLDPIILGKGFLQLLDETLPPSAGFRRDQTKQALTAFVRGIENWHREDTADSGLRPRLRLKSGPKSTQTPLNQQENHYTGSSDRQARSPVPELLSNGMVNDAWVRSPLAAIGRTIDQVVNNT